MSSEPIQVVESEAYLGVTISRNVIADKFLRERVQKTYVRLQTMKSIGLDAKGFGRRLRKNV